MLLAALPNPNPSVSAQTWSLKMEALSWGSSVQEIPLIVCLGVLRDKKGRLANRENLDMFG